MVLMVGDRVRKIVGFPFVGTIVSSFTTSAGKRRFDVEHDDGWIHVHNPEHLAPDHPEYQYLDLLKELLEKGTYREGRNGGTYGLFGRQIRFDLSKGFPLLTTKRLFTKAIVVELLWFLRGETNVKYLQDRGVTIWDEWADAHGELGPIYGKQWRSWPTGRWKPMVREGVSFQPNTVEPDTIDQIKNLIDGLKKDPYGRRHIVTAWNPAEIPDMALPPCHCLFQFFVSDGKLSCQLYQRSADVFLGVPFNIASYALLTHLVAREVGLEVGEFVHTFGDVHLYANHVEQAKEQLTRTPLPFPQVKFHTNPAIFDYDWRNISFENYVSYEAIKAEVSV